MNSELPRLQPIGYSPCTTKYTGPHSNLVSARFFPKLIGLKKLYAVRKQLDWRFSFFLKKKKDFLILNLLINISGVYEGTCTGHLLQQGQVRGTTVLWCCWWTVRQTSRAAAVCAGDAERQRHNNQVKTPTVAKEMATGVEVRRWRGGGGQAGGWGNGTLASHQRCTVD